MPNQVRTTGNVTGRMLVVSMIKAHAAVSGNWRTKQQFGADVLKNYLRQNSVREAAWLNRTALPPSAVLARASMSITWLNKAGELIEGTTDVRARRSILHQIKLALGAGGPPFLIRFMMPEIQLKMIDIPSGIFLGRDADYQETKIPVSAFRCSQYPVTNAQYQIFLQQTGANPPFVWENRARFEGETASDAVEVKYNEALKFASWQRRRILTVNQGFYAAQNEERFGLKLLDSDWEWRKPEKLVKEDEVRVPNRLKQEQESADRDHSVNIGYYSADDFLAARSFYHKHRQPVHEQNEAAFRLAESAGR